MSDKIKWDVWGHKAVIEAGTYKAAVAEYRRLISIPDGMWDTYERIPVEAKAHQSDDNAETLRRQRDEYKRKYEEEVSKNGEAREALDKIHEALGDTTIYDRD